jgi:ubiquinol-cytochrome c reductase cytochrome b subunit
MSALHQNGSNNPLGFSSSSDKINFFPYFFIKDTLSLVCGLTLLSFFVYHAPNILGHSDNYIPGNPMVTPEHIVPEWYFLPAYAILRAIPNKLLGVISLFGSLLVLLILPLVNTSESRSLLYRPVSQKFFWLLIADYIFLGYLGQQVAESPYIEIGQVLSIFYFSYFLVIIPVIGSFEKSLRFA